MDEVKICECVRCGDRYFAIGDIVTVYYLSAGVDEAVCHGRIKTIHRLATIPNMVLDTSSDFRSSEMVIDVCDIVNMCTYEKGEEK